MAGIATTFAGAAVAAPLFKIPPVTSGQVLWEYFGNSLVNSPNLIGVNPTLIGCGQVFSPSGNYATLTPGTGCLDTGIADVAGSFTAMFVSRSTASSGVAAPIDCSGSAGAQISLGNRAGLQCFVQGSGAHPKMAMIPGGSMTFKFYAIVFTSGVGCMLFDMTDGPTGNVNAVGAGVGIRSASSQTWKLGERGNGVNGSLSPIDLAWVGLCEVSALSLPTLIGVYQSVQASIALRGITI